jgi:uncharacterized Fe-S cluster protein YjdI
VKGDAVETTETSGREEMALKDTLRHYTSEAIDITYDARRCIHAAECVSGLPAVFDTDRRPWILPSGASADAIAAVIERCPSGALHYTRRDGGAPESPTGQTVITPEPGGPLYVRGLIQLRSPDATTATSGPTSTMLALTRQAWTEVYAYIRSVATPRRCPESRVATTRW